MKECKYRDEEWVGKRYGHLVIERYDRETAKFVMRCDCGGETYAKPTLLFAGKYKTCGISCKYHQEGYDRRSKDRVYNIWRGMLNRCGNPKSQGFKTYGGRGISVCEEWENDFWAFREWAYSNGYEEGLTLDRINNNGNYEPSNCRWATYQEQRDNANDPYTFTQRPWHKRGTVLYEIDGIIKSKQEWCDYYGVSYSFVSYRMKKLGMSFEEALKTPKYAMYKKIPGK